MARRLLGQRKRRRSKSTPAAVPKQRRQEAKRKQWDDKSMIAAMEDVRDGKMSINQSASVHGVPRTTLKDRLSGRVKHGTKPGPKPYLTNEEEASLANHLVEAASIGYGKTRKEVKILVEKIAEDKSVLRGNKVTDGWWRRFRERQPQLALRRGDPTTHVRMDSTNKEAIEKYYNLLEETLKEHNLMNTPAQIYNMDESGMPLDPRPPNVIAKRGQKKVRYRVSGKKDQITVLGCVNAVGQFIPPMIIFEGKYLNHQWTEGEVPGTYYGMSGKGWTDQELFRHWLQNHFLKYAVPGRPLLLLLDGHSSHYEVRSVEIAKEEGVILFCLPPHTTQDSQPLDCTVFGPLKRHWSDVCHSFLHHHPGVIISKFNFSRLFSEAWMRALTPSNIIAGFRKCGIHPFNRQAIPLNHQADDGSTSTADQDSVDEDSVDHMESNSHLPSDEVTSRFTPGQIELFKQRLSEGYDLLIDPEYVAWLQLTHPEAVQHNITSPLGPNGQSMLDAFSDVSPMEAVPLTESAHQSTIELTSAVQHEYSSLSHHVSNGTLTDDTCSGPSDATHSLNVSPASSSSPTLTIQSPSSNPVTAGILSATSESTPQSAQHKVETPSRTLKCQKNVSPIDKYLHMPVQSVVRKKRTAASSHTRAMTGARVLTSAECLAIIKEKELKKKNQEEEKENRKKQREEKKRQQEEEKKKKAELRLQREKERERKAQEKSRKADERSKKSACGSNATGSSTASKDPPTRSQAKRALRDSTNTVPAKRLCMETVDSNRCCVCLQSYDEDVELGCGVEWIQCACLRWLHEDCIIDCTTDSSGKERLCPFCS